MTKYNSNTVIECSQDTSIIVEEGQNSCLIKETFTEVSLKSAEPKLSENTTVGLTNKDIKQRYIKTDDIKNDLTKKDSNLLKEDADAKKKLIEDEIISENSFKHLPKNKIKELNELPSKPTSS